MNISSIQLEKIFHFEITAKRREDPVTFSPIFVGQKQVLMTGSLTKTIIEYSN